MISNASIFRLAAVALLGLIAGQRILADQRSPGLQAYHDRVKQSAALVPGHIGPWVAQDVPVLARAVKLLQPNIMISRQYTNVENGQTAGLLAVHCPDAHDMVGHYPPRCYPADGWDLESQRQITWQFDGKTMEAMEYKLTLPAPSPDEPTHTIIVDNFLMRPGSVLRDMDSLSNSIMGARGQAAGAGQMQIYFFDSTLDEAQRAAIFQELVDGYHPVIQAILADIPS
jgi:Protein of unknown function (DUF3485)